MDAYLVTVDDEAFDVIIETPNGCPETFKVHINGREISVVLPQEGAGGDGTGWILVDGCPHEVKYDPQLRWLADEARLHRIRVHECYRGVQRPEARDGMVKSPIPGQIVQTLVSAGEAVLCGQAVVILEAMKMQNEICACRSGVVREVFVRVGQCVGQSEKLLEIV